MTGIDFSHIRYRDHILEIKQNRRNIFKFSDILIFLEPKIFIYERSVAYFFYKFHLPRKRKNIFNSSKFPGFENKLIKIKYVPII